MPAFPISNKLVVNNLYEVINKFSFIFKYEGRYLRNVEIDAWNLSKIDLIGILLFYKVTEFVYKKNCFANPGIVYKDDGVLKKSLVKYGFSDRILRFFTVNDSIGKMPDFEIQFEGEVVIAPAALVREKRNTKDKFDYKILEALDKLYEGYPDPMKSSLLQCSTEISSNFYNHAIEDLDTIILARATTGSFEIACIDNGSGIVKTFDNNVTNIDDRLEILKSSFKKGVTSKPDSNHMGYGLWLLDSIVKKYDGHLLVVTDGLKYEVRRNKIQAMSFPFWKGTLVYLKLPIREDMDLAKILDNPDRVSEIMNNINMS